ncbi:calsyntenin-2-like [Sinocyclocheilus anshuiensis]|uniref:calsyntenin-2-like n=1 Tax=Sinocyclocheilus anshuiensis TaxID=1608454 RepID=UPI0007B7A924|nr:PREDICTED: calsyntenin-2-like [Sinocyclocheilus anshuiensis]
MKRILVLMLLALGLSCVHRVNKHKPWIESSYHGVITENTDVVLLDPPLVALDKDAPVPYAGEICGFHVQGLSAPFEAVVLNRTSGEGRLRAHGPIDCERQREFTFIIQARDCGTGPEGHGEKRSHKAVVHVQVGDVNEFSPVFGQLEYHGSVTEGKVYDSILQVQASDQDCSPQYSQICNYQITSQDTAFAIDRNGNIRNTESLSFDKESHYKIHVTAFDCGQKRAAQDAVVHIHVKPICKPGWQGWSKLIDYEPGTGSKPLFPKMHLETCVGSVSWIRTTVELETSSAGRGCDRQSYSERSLQKLCGASSGSTDLLPAPSGVFNWTATLVADGGRDSDLTYRFDGRQAAKIPDWVIPQNLTHQFTITTWMKHGPSPGQRAEKETLLCNSDKTDMLRTDYTQTDSFRPAEFHWKLEQICDKEWHYYVISVDFPVVTLYVDGVTYDPYLVTDDWPIHSSQIDVQLTVGACWQGGEVSKVKFTQYFRGSLSGLTIRSGKIASQKTISCLQACKEGLDITSLESLGQRIKFHLNPAQSLVVMEGEDLEQMMAALRKVSYINSRQFPTKEARHLRISTAVQCFGEDVCISVPDIEAVVMVMQPSEPCITITGAEHLTVPASDLALGLSLFRDLHIISTVTKSDGQTNTDHRSGALKEIAHNLDYCDIMVLGEGLRAGLESLELHHSALLGKHLQYVNSSTGMSIYGVDSVCHYAEVIRQVRYQSRQAVDSIRTFRLTCSELNGRYTSDQYMLQINILHSEEATEHVNHAMAPPKYMQIIHPTVTESNSYSLVVLAVATAVIVVCIAALLVVLLSVYRLNQPQNQEHIHTHTLPEKQADCDRSSLSITVNPLESFQELQSAEEVTEEEEEDDCDISTTESDSDEEETTMSSIHHQTRMQWGTSTLHC